MKGPLSLWSMLDLRRRVIIVGATLAMFAAVLAIARNAAQPDYVLLYAGLEDGVAGEVVAALDQRGVAYDVRGSAIYVDAAARDSLRLSLAADGLPANGGQGYELLDGLSGFGTTSQMFDAAYWRAKEGELARTALAMPQIRAARVHIARQPDSPFRRDSHPSASITVTTATGSLDSARARALRHLIATAVPDLRPEDVEVIDSVAGLISDDALDAEAPGAASARAAEIRGNVERLLAARVGPGRAVVEVAVDLVTDRERVTERSFDPQGRVAISSETEQKSGSNQQGDAGVTVASNLPEGDAAAGKTDRSQSSESRERVNYEVSETQREIERLPGSIRRMTVAVLVDGETATAADGTVTTQPRADAELAVLRDLVASAVGLDESRGDVLTVKSLAFQPPRQDGTTVEAGLLPPISTIDLMSLAQIGILALVALGLGLFVVRPVLLSGRRAAALPSPSPALALPSAPLTASEVLEGVIDDSEVPPGRAMLSGRVTELPEEPPQDPVARLRRLIEQRQTETVEILRGWMEAGEESA